MDIDEKADLMTLTSVALAAGRRDWTEFDERLAPYQGAWPSKAALERDHPWLLEHAGQYAREAGRPERARLAWNIARRLWERLGRRQEAARVSRWTESLPEGDGR